MRRRDFIKVAAGSMIPYAFASRAQQKAMSVIGYLDGGSPNRPYKAAFLQGLSEGGYIEGQTVAIVHRWADGRYDLLPGLATDLVHRGVAAIFATSAAGRAAKEVTTTIPIVFVSGEDPIKSGLVASISRPEGNVTGASLYSTALGPKKLELVRELIPRSGVIGVLVDRGNPASEAEADIIAVTAQAVGQQVRVIGVSSEIEIDRAFETYADEKITALLVTTGVFLYNHKQQIIGLADHYALPAIYDRHEFATAGGLMSYGTRFPDVFRQAGIYVARILKGAKPVDLPVLQPTTFELVINLKAAKALGLNVSRDFQLRADEVIE